MCIVFVSLDDHPDYALVVCANRDEQRARPAERLGRREVCGGVRAARECLAGRDGEAGGHWLAATCDHDHDRALPQRWAVVTNVAGDEASAGAPSRGTLAGEWLGAAAAATPAGHAAGLGCRTAGTMAGYNLVFGDVTAAGAVRAYHASNRAAPAELERGVHGVANDVGTHVASGKLDAGKALLQRVLADPAHAGAPEALVEALLETLLTDPKHYLDPAQCGAYCTLVSTVLLVGRDGRARVVERDRTAPHGAEGATRAFETAWPAARPAGDDAAATPPNDNNNNNNDDDDDDDDDGGGGDGDGDGDMAAAALAFADSDSDSEAHDTDSSPRAAARLSTLPPAQLACLRTVELAVLRGADAAAAEVHGAACLAALGADTPNLAAALSLAALVAAGEYAEALRTSPLRWLVEDDATDGGAAKGTAATDALQAAAYKYARGGASPAERHARRLVASVTGAAALRLYQQVNYTGPAVSDGSLAGVVVTGIELRTAALRDGTLTTEEQEASPTARKLAAVRAALACDGALPSRLAEHPSLLFAARCILGGASGAPTPLWASGKAAAAAADAPPTPTSWWTARAAVAHRRLLLADDTTPSLWAEVSEAFDAARAALDPHGKLLAQLWLESGLAEHHFDRPLMGKEAFAKAVSASTLAHSLTGAMGKRTKYQVEEKAQMVLLAQSDFSNDPEADGAPRAVSTETPDAFAPANADLAEDSILLPSTEYAEEAVNNQRMLHPVDQAIVLALCLDVANSNPKHGLTTLEMRPYVERVLKHPIDWMIESTALLERAWLDFESSYSRDRAVLQMQALVDQHSSRLTLMQADAETVEGDATARERLARIDCVVHPPQWELKRDLAERYAALGVIESARVIFEELGLWGDVVDCLTRSGKKSKAEAIVRARLESPAEATPAMHYALGDLTDDDACFEKAWELSGGRYARAKRMLGIRAYSRNDLEAACAHLEAAVAIKPLEAVGAWFRLGAARMRLARWQGAVDAFTKVVAQEPEEGEAWANMASVHLQMKHSDQAYHCLQEAVKTKRSSFKIWENLLTVCMDLGKHREACHVMAELLRLNRPPHLAALRALAKAGAVGQAADGAGSGGRLGAAVAALLEQVAQTKDCGPGTWEAYAAFEFACGHTERACAHAFKRCRATATAADGGWHTDLKRCAAVADAVEQLAEVHVALAAKGAPPPPPPAAGTGAASGLPPRPPAKPLYLCRSFIAGLMAKMRHAYLDESPEYARLGEALAAVDAGAEG